MISRGMKRLVPLAGARPDLGDPVPVSRQRRLQAVPPRHGGIEDRLPESQPRTAKRLDGDATGRAVTC
jgi:hypothetical protein